MPAPPPSTKCMKATTYAELTGRRKRFIDAYLGEASRNATEAARIAGYGTPESQGSSLKKRLKLFIKEREQEISIASQLSQKETLEIISEIARDKGHKDRLKAAELMAKIHGVLSEKVTLEVNRSQIQEQLSMLRQRLITAASTCVVLPPSGENNTDTLAAVDESGGNQNPN